MVIESPRNIEETIKPSIYIMFFYIPHDRVSELAYYRFPQGNINHHAIKHMYWANICNFFLTLPLHHQHDLNILPFLLGNLSYNHFFSLNIINWIMLLHLE